MDTVLDRLERSIEDNIELENDLNHMVYKNFKIDMNFLIILKMKHFD